MIMVGCTEGVESILEAVKSLCLYQFFKADFQSVEFSERAEILLFAGKKVALKLNR